MEDSSGGLGFYRTAVFALPFFNVAGVAKQAEQKLKEIL